MKSIERKSPSKINIGLYIKEKRKDGFHNIETIFYPIKLSDTIRILESTEKSFTSNDKELEQNESNLILKAKNLMESKIGNRLKCSFHLEKKIPIGAGLGGGSSNAATTIFLINDFFNLHLSHDTIKAIAVELGSDVPFFLNPVPSIGTSRGEVLTPVDILINDPILLVNPGINVSTKWAYENVIPNNDNSILNLINQKPFEDYVKSLTNDFEKSVFTKYPLIKVIKEYLISEGAYYASMSGSGSSVFGMFKDINQVNKACAELSKKYFTFLNI